MSAPTPPPADPRDPFASVHDRATLDAALRETLSHCNCGSEDTVAVLAEYLQLVKARTDATSGPIEGFSAASRRLEAFIESWGRPAIGCWFVYLMDHARLAYHGFNIFDLTITDRGRSLLAAIERSGVLTPEPPKA